MSDDVRWIQAGPKTDNMGYPVTDSRYGRWCYANYLDAFEQETRTVRWCRDCNGPADDNCDGTHGFDSHDVVDAPVIIPPREEQAS